MSKNKGRHLTKEDRGAIEAGLYDNDSARRIARCIGVSASTVTREVKANRTLREKKSAHDARLALRCIRYKDCQASGSACEKCSTKLTTCKHCKMRSCIDTCPDFVRTMCPTTQSWPFICPKNCPKKAWCGYPRCSYSAADADSAYRLRLSCTREGINVTPEELKAMDELITPLVRQGQSFEAIWATHAEELPVGVRTAYNYQSTGILSTANIELPRKVRMKKRKDKDKDKATSDRIDRSGRTFADFQALPLTDQARVVQGDSVEGYRENRQDVLSLHFVARAFQLYLPKKHADAAATVACLDVIERMLGSRDAFEAALGIMLLDRGVEFDDWVGMERSCLEPGRARCRVFYCDPMATNQKSQAERNHEQLRRILPKGRSDFDALSAWDVATCCSHVNSYPSAGRGGKCPFELLGDLLSQELLDGLGIVRMAPDEVVLKPSLITHAVVQ
jgi:IS30 family transposase